jgi:predicted dehydrogenase
MSRHHSRREFLQGAALAGAGFWAAGAESVAAGKSPNEKLNIAVAGVAGRGGGDMNEVAEENIVALCDVNEDFLGAAAKRFPKAKTYHDWRKMLEQKDIDAVVCGTTEHTHAPISAAAIRLGKHVYCEKPIAHTVHEARVLQDLSKQAKVATQQGTQIHATDNYRRVVELVQSGVIGTIKEAHGWCDRVPLGPRKRPKDVHPVPSNLHWDLWLGPAPARPYHPTYFTGGCLWWDKWWDFGNGTLGGMAVHILDLVHWALDLQHPMTIEADSNPKGGYPESYPEWLTARWEYPSHGQFGPITVYWHDGGKKPESPPGVNLKEWGIGILFVGDKGTIVADYGRRVLLPADKFKGFQAPKPWILSSPGHHQEWLTACKTGSPTLCNFDYGGRLVENLLLSIVACRVKKQLEWDPLHLKATNCPEADQFIRKQYREGWSVC